MALSNTGNLQAKDVSVNIPLPAVLQNVTIAAIPDGAAHQYTPSPGHDQPGVLQVTGVTVEVGKVQEVRFTGTAPCTTDANAITLAAAIAGTQMTPFSVQAAPLVVGGPGVQACLGQDPHGTLERIDPVPALAGGGCTALGASWAWVLSVAALAWRRRHTAGVVALTLLLLGTGCGARHPAQNAVLPSDPLQNTDHLPG